MHKTIHIWHRAPFIRLLVAFICGILLQYELKLSFHSLIIALGTNILFILAFEWLPLKKKFQLGYLPGFLLNLTLTLCAAILTWLHYIPNDRQKIGKNNNGSIFLVTLEEPLVEKVNSFKALATVNAVQVKDSFKKVNGKIIIYFKKDTSLNYLDYGSQIFINKPLQTIKSSGNPAGFDYSKWCLFQKITHQVYLTPTDFIYTGTTKINWLKNFIFDCRAWVIKTIRSYIPGEKEQGLAEALLIGYKDDLDKNLVQSYSNTGVVHVIAISGLHLGLIYGILIFITSRFKKKKLLLLRVTIILSSLWLFSILAGAQPSVLRSAVMFSFIALAEVISRRTLIYNTLALSAFVLLCINPYWLWDVGFQLSYAAVTSIIIFYKPVCNWFYFRTKLTDAVWKLFAVTISAQILTLPISIYHFHQFPTMFLFTNLIAVPLSSIVLIGEIFLCAIFFITPVAVLLGKFLSLMILLMNSIIEWFGSFPFSVWTHLYIDQAQMVLLTIIVLSAGFWLMDKKKQLLWISLASFILFMTIRSLSFYHSLHQKKIIVYNVPKMRAIDFISSRMFHFAGDSDFSFDESLENFHLKPSRILHRTGSVPASNILSKDLVFCKKKIVILDSTLSFKISGARHVIDLLILSGNPRLYMTDLERSFDIKIIVMDSSVPEWKAALWGKGCDSLQIPYYIVSDKGAFVMNL